MSHIDPLAETWIPKIRKFNECDMDYSIIIPTFNSEKYLKKCIDSIFLSDFKGNFEIIIVDGGSSDSTVSIAASYHGVQIVTSSNVSVSNSRNLGVRNSSGNIIVFIDSDCLIHKFFLENAREFLKKYDCYGSFYQPDPSQSWVSKVWLDVERKHDGLVSWVTSGTLAVTRRAFEEVLGFNEALQAEEDEDFCYRIRKNNGLIYNDSKVASIHLGQSDSIGEFFKKESWRGKSLIKPKFSLVPFKFSLFDAVVLFYFFSIVCMIVFYNFTYIFCLGGLYIVIIPILFSIRTTIITRKYSNFFKILFLYYVYFLARSWSIIQYKQWNNFFKKTGYPLRSSYF